MLIATIASPETTHKDLAWDVSEKTIENFNDALQVSGQLSADTILRTLKMLEIKITSNKLSPPLCQKVTDVIIKYLRTLKPSKELEEKCTAVLLAIGSYHPEMITEKLWDRVYLYTLPPRSLLVAVGKLTVCPGIAHCIGTTWEHILRLLGMTQEEEDMLALCQALSGLVVNVRKHLDLGAHADEVMDITQEAVSIKAYYTLRVLLNRWPMKTKEAEQALVIAGHLFFLIAPSKLKNQVNQLVRWLMMLFTHVTPFYISQCVCQLVDSLALSGCGGVNLESQLENLTAMLLRLLTVKVNTADPHSVQNSHLVLRTFSVLTKLYSDQVVFLLRKTMETRDPDMVASALQVFMDLFQEVTQSEKRKSEILHSTIIMVQTDLKPVRKDVLSFIEMLGQHKYLALPQSNAILDYMVKLSVSDSFNEVDIRILCSKILQMVSLPRLVTVMCEPSSVLAFVPLCETVLEMALKAQSQGKTPYLSGFHLTPTQFVTPQNLLSCLVTFLYKFFGFTLWSSSDKTLVQMMITALVLTTHEDLAEREACGGALTKCTKVIVGLSLTEAFRHTTLSDHIHVLEETCKYLVGTGKLQLVGDLLSQSFDFLKSPQFFLRAAALNFIGFTVKRLNMKLIHPKDVQLLRSVLTSLNNDPMEDIPILAHNVLKAIEDSLASGYASTSRLTQLSRHFFKWSCLKHTERKKRLFKTVKREKAESDQKRTPRTWLQSPLASLRNWYKSL